MCTSFSGLGEMVYHTITFLLPCFRSEILEKCYIEPLMSELNIK